MNLYEDLSQLRLEKAELNGGSVNTEQELRDSIILEGTMFVKCIICFIANIVQLLKLNKDSKNVKRSLSLDTSIFPYLTEIKIDDIQLEKHITYLDQRMSGDTEDKIQQALRELRYFYTSFWQIGFELLNVSVNVILFIFSLKFGSQNYIGVSVISYIYYFQTILFITIVASVYLGIMVGILIIVCFMILIKAFMGVYLLFLFIYLIVRVTLSKKQKKATARYSENQAKSPYFQNHNLNTTGLLSTDDSEHDCHDVCLICLETYKSTDMIIYFPCHSTHNFHQQCTLQWLKTSKTCPVCRFNVSNMFDDQYLIVYNYYNDREIVYDTKFRRFILHFNHVSKTFLEFPVGYQIRYGHLQSYVVILKIILLY